MFLIRFVRSGVLAGHVIGLSLLPSLSNAAADLPIVLISEVQTNGGVDKPGDEFIELYNPNAKPVDTTGNILRRGSSLGYSATLSTPIINPHSYQPTHRRYNRLLPSPIIKHPVEH